MQDILCVSNTLAQLAKKKKKFFVQVLLPAKLYVNL